MLYTIYVEKRRDDYMAFLNNDLTLWECDTTEYGAVEKVATRFGLYYFGIIRLY